MAALLYRLTCYHAWLFVFVLAFSQHAFAASPFLAFSDLLSGPATGLGDGKGSGVIVTVWGQNLGEQGSDRKLLFQDSSGKLLEPYVYYWKAADGQLPGGPANLAESHQMQEVAFSIPEAASGPGKIFVEVAGQRSNVLPFTVRDGAIYHVSSRGSDGGDGSWNSPWASVSHALSVAPAGSTIYVQDVTSGSRSSATGLFWNNSKASSSLAAQFGIVAYPGYQPVIIGQRGFEAYRAEGPVLSKFDIYSSDYTSVSSTGQPSGSRIHFGGTWGIRAAKDGRAVANRIGDIPGMCASRYEGAIVGTDGIRVSNFKILGNEIYDYGCEGSSKLHHTTYMSIRSGPDNVLVDPWEFGYNYLHGNKAKFGIHNFDQNEGCGRTTGPIRIYNNVVKDQGGAGISVGASANCRWEMDFYIENNVLINVGLAAAWDGRDPATSDGSEPGGIAIRDSGLTGTIYIRNNLIYQWSTDGDQGGADGCLSFNGSSDFVTVLFDNNVCYTEQDKPFFMLGYQSAAKADNASGSNNAWYYAGSGTPQKAQVPAWDSNPITSDPEITLSGSLIVIDQSSPLVDQGKGVAPARGIYGNLRDASPDVGALEIVEGLIAPPNPPQVIEIQ